jgi:hypothetical protein
MTTIAISDGVVAVDTQLTGGNYTLRAQKAIRLVDGSVAVACGLWRNAWAGLQYVAGGERGDAPDIEGSTVIVVRPDGSIHVADDAFPLYPIMDRSYCAGCGQDLARKALADGKTPVQAVAEACELDALSSAPIMVMRAHVVEYEPPEFHEVKRGRAPKRR